MPESAYPNSPYHFVPLPESGVDRQAAPPHDRFQTTSGRLVVRLRTLSPLFIGRGGEKEQDQEQQYLLTSAGRLVIPGSSLKGMIRSTFEAVSQSCLRLYKGEYRTRTPQNYVVPAAHLPQVTQEKGVSGCQDPANLCLACRVFGMVAGGRNHLGQVAIGEARPEDPDLQPARGFSIIPLMQPRPHHRAFYVLPPNQRIGRKFYFHGSQVRTSNHARKKCLDRVIPKDATFRFVISLTNLDKGALDILVYSLLLESTMAHRLGQGKAAGLGSVQLQLAEADLFPDPVARFKSWKGGEHHLTGEALTSWITEIYQRLAPNMGLPHLKALRAILRFPDPINRRYPSTDWFGQNPRVPLAPLDQNLPQTLPSFEPWSVPIPTVSASGKAGQATTRAPTPIRPEELPPVEATVTFNPGSQKWKVQFQLDGKPKSVEIKDGGWLGNRLEEIRKQVAKKRSVTLTVRVQRDGNNFTILGLG